MELFIFCLAAVMVLTVIMLQGIYCAFYCFYPLPGGGPSPLQNLLNRRNPRQRLKAAHSFEIQMGDVEKRPPTPTPSSDTARLTPSSLDVSTRGETDV